MTRVLLTFGKHPKTLSAVRSLSRSGRTVFVSDDTSSAMSAYSKCCAAFFRTASPLTSASLFLSQIKAICRSHAVDLVIPMDDAECDLLSVSHHNEISASVALPPRGSYWVARDKYRTLECAESIGISIPETRVITSDDSLSSAIDSVGLPTVIKPRIGSGSRGFMLLSDQKEFDLVRRLRKTYGELLAQEFIPSHATVGASLLYNHGERRAVFLHKRILQFPPSGGPSILRESVHNPQVAQLATSVLDTLEWHGVAMVEFRIDSRTDQPILMEINPRFWGSLPLAIASGVDFPSLLCDIFEKGECAFVNSYKVGVKCANFLPFGLAAIMCSLQERATLGNTVSLLSADCFDVESLEDPMPTFGALLSMARSFVNPNMIRAVFRKSS